MKRILLGTLAVAAVFTFSLPVAAQSDQQPSREVANHETMLHAKLARMKAGLALRPEQENLWDAFESAVTSAFKSHTEAAQTETKAQENGKPMSPVDRMDTATRRMTQSAGELKKVSDAAKPLYANLDDTQKRNFELLGPGVAQRDSQRASDKPSVEGYTEPGSAGFGWFPPGWFGPKPAFR
jgi:zinc resistance-associated protein